MKRLLTGKIDLFLSAGLACALAALVMWLAHRAEGPEALQRRVQDHIQADFKEAISQHTFTSASIAKNYGKTGDIGPRDQVVRVVLDKNCQVVDWNNSELLPPNRTLSDLCNYPNRRTLQDRNKIFYFLRHETPDYYFVTLVPISIRYKVENAYLPPYLFLGRYNAHNISIDQANIDIHLRQVAQSVKVFDPEGNFVFCLTIPQIELFAHEARTWVLWLALGAVVLFGWGVFRRTRGKWLRMGRVGVPVALGVVAGLWGLRALMFYFELPNAYLASNLFSPNDLAIGKYTPSLGDLLLNTALLLATVWTLLREYRRQISRLYRKALRRTIVAWMVQAIVLALCAMLAWWFFGLMDKVVKHSTIYLEFSNVFELTTNSYLVFLALAMVLVALQSILQELLRFSFHFLQGPHWGAKLALSTIWLMGLSYWLFGLEWAYLICVAIVFALSLLVFLRTKRAVVFRLDLLNFLLIVFIFSLLTATGMVKGAEVRKQVEMETVADRQSDEHDLITESLFERVVQEVDAEAFLLDYTQAEGLSRRLSEQFFESSFKGYEVRIFLYDTDMKLLDKTGDYRPYLFPDSDPSLEQMGRPTMTRDLFLVKYYKGLFESIYIGKFNLLMRTLGNVLVWVELLPTEIQPNRLYPQLLLDDHVRSKAAIDNKYAYAVYKDGRLFRKNSDGQFPIFYNGPSSLDSLRFQYEQKGRYNSVFYKPTSDKVIHVRSERPTPFDAANLFSFIFYFFILAAILLMSPFWVMRLVRNPRETRKLSLRARIQIFFLIFSVLPLFIVVFFLSPYVRDHIYADIKSDLLQQTQQVAGQVRDDYLRLRRNRNAYAAVHGQVSASHREQLIGTLESVEKTFFNDINIYLSTGELYYSTQPAIYELGLTSRYMNPDVYRKMRAGLVSDAVIEDQVGNVTYFSGYYPIMNDDRRIVGFLNIPSYKNQDKVNAQSLSLLTLLVNIYVFVFLAIGILAVLISNSIIRPLALLGRKLQATTLGRRNEPLEWDSSDEIGEIIQAYNDMLKKLAESEQKLAQNEREMAWQEMARQVAHEIKNPLTPMRLSVQHLVRAWETDKPLSERLNNLFDKVTKTILVQIESLVNIANSFSQFAKMPEPQKTTFRLQEVVQEVADLYSHEGTVQLNLDIPPKDFYVHSDRDQLSRVLNNLVKNAVQAIEGDGGRIDVRMEILEDKLARITVQDNGKGIPGEIQARVFEPRFSTKSSGMGLGLAIVKKIVEGAGGRIYFESEVGKGTKFFVELPGADTAA